VARHISGGRTLPAATDTTFCRRLSHLLLNSRPHRSPLCSKGRADEQRVVQASSGASGHGTASSLCYAVHANLEKHWSFCNSTELNIFKILIYLNLIHGKRDGATNAIDIWASQLRHHQTKQTKYVRKGKQLAEHSQGA
jgi:hypothetical protein